MFSKVFYVTLLIASAGIQANAGGVSSKGLLSGLQRGTRGDAQGGSAGPSSRKASVSKAAADLAAVGGAAGQVGSAGGAAASVSQDGSAGSLDGPQSFNDTRGLTPLDTSSFAGGSDGSVGVGPDGLRSFWSATTPSSPPDSGGASPDFGTPLPSTPSEEFFGASGGGAAGGGDGGVNGGDVGGTVNNAGATVPLGSGSAGGSGGPSSGITGARGKNAQGTTGRIAKIKGAFGKKLKGLGGRKGKGVNRTKAQRDISRKAAGSRMARALRAAEEDDLVKRTESWLWA